MENMARLALLEKSVKDNEKFKNLLHDLLQHINLILKNPYDINLRSFNSNLLKSVQDNDAFVDYLKYIGFLRKGNQVIYPKEASLGNLKMARAAIERKIQFCYGSPKECTNDFKIKTSKGPSFVAANILTTKNPLLLKLEVLFNMVIQYEDEELQDLARDQIPIVTLQLKALERIREQQRKIKNGETSSADLSYDMALLMELLVWFKYQFFSWVDKPPCTQCGGSTFYSGSSEEFIETETCLVEHYSCRRCSSGGSKFARHNDPVQLLRRRRGRCGEWAACFTLLARALAYDTRYVYDVTDHVWCEVFDFDTRSWLHVDPCECKLDAPLIYSVGWGKKLSYVLAVSRDDLQDVTWRYTTKHKEVLKRRDLCKEGELVDAILKLRAHRQSQVSEARRRFLALRNIKELVKLMAERQVTASDCEGRISGELTWRRQRGEGGREGGEILLSRAGLWTLYYTTSTDSYTIYCDDTEEMRIDSWVSGAYLVNHMFRKEENDWNMVYLAREEDQPVGQISWQINSPADIQFDSLSLMISATVYENGIVTFTVKFDDELPEIVNIDDNGIRFVRNFNKVLITVRLEGGIGRLAWQHSQLFRQQKNDTSSTMKIIANARKL